MSILVNMVLCQLTFTCILVHMNVTDGGDRHVWRTIFRSGSRTRLEQVAGASDGALRAPQLSRSVRTFRSFPPASASGRG